MMSIHVLLLNCLMHNPDVFAEKTVRASTSETFKSAPTFKNMMRFLLDQILRRRRTVERTANDWDAAAYLNEAEDDTADQRPSRSRVRLQHPQGASTSRRRVPSDASARPATSR